MSADLIEGRTLAKQVRSEITARAGHLRSRGHAPCLAVVAASADPAVVAYARSKERLAGKLDFELRLSDIDPARGQAALEDHLSALSADPAVHGILLELPVDPAFDGERALACIDPIKDVDGLTPTNLGRIAGGNEDGALISATPLACIRLAETVMPVAGKRAAIIGRGRTVGRPLAALLTNRHATVTVCHSRTDNLAEAVAPADFVFTATGAPGLVDGSVVREGQIVVDAGISVVDGSVVGDVDAASVQAKVRAMTPVPGGVGTLTSALIFDNVLKAMALQGIDTELREAG